MDINFSSQSGQTFAGISGSIQGQVQNLNSDKSNTASNEEPSVKNQGSGAKVSEENMKKAVDKLNKLLEDKQTHVEYESYGKFKDTVIKIIDDNTKQIIKEIPSEKIIDLVDKLCELAGVFVNEKA